MTGYLIGTKFFLYENDEIYQTEKLFCYTLYF